VLAGFFIMTVALTQRISNQAAALVMLPRRYRFFDFVKVDSILTVVVFAIVMWLVPIFWPL
jgi:di/tricarboxylate transporter